MRAQHTHQEPGVTICVPRCQTSSHSPQVGEPLCLVLVTILVTLATNCRVVNQPHLYGYNRAFFPHDVTPLMQSACQSAARRPRASLVPGAGRIARRMPKGRQAGLHASRMPGSRAGRRAKPVVPEGWELHMGPAPPACGANLAHGRPCVSGNGEPILPDSGTALPHSDARLAGCATLVVMKSARSSRNLRSL